MRQQFRHSLSALFIAAIAITSFAACKKDSSHPATDYNKAPRKPAPASLVGEWSFTQVSSTNIVDRYGHNVPTTMFGATFHINADGTGWEAITSTVNTYSTSNKEDVNTDGTYEIEVDNNDGFTLKYYPIQGKVYDNDHFSHNVGAEKLYPQTFFTWQCTLNEENGKVYFENNGSRFYRK